MQQLVDTIDLELRNFAPAYVTDAEKAIFRIYRDVRFSKDKRPYKENIAASFHNGRAGYYVSISHKEVAIGGGAYRPEPKQLIAIREHIAGHHEEFRRILSGRLIRKLFGDLRGDQLSRVPKGFPAEHPAADLLRFKSYILYVELEPALATSPKLYDEIVVRFRAMIPFLQFLQAPAATRK